MNENVATQGHGSKVIAGELLDACIDGDIYNYDLERGYTRHTIGLPDQCIIVKLGKPSIINHLKLLLWDRDNRSYSYYIEVSLELKDWIRVIDYNQYACRSWQSLFFDTRVVQYIKIVGTNNTSNKVKVIFYSVYVVLEIIFFEQYFNFREYLRIKKSLFSLSNGYVMLIYYFGIPGVSFSIFECNVQRNPTDRHKWSDMSHE